MNAQRRGAWPYLVVETAFGIKVVEKVRVGVSPPEVHVSDLKVTPDCEDKARRQMVINQQDNVARESQRTVAEIVSLSAVL